MIRSVLILTVPVLLSACVQTVSPVSKQPEKMGCAGAGFQGLVGQPQAALSALRLPQGTRVIGPDQPVTMDFRPDRMNVEIGPDGRIARIGCY